MLAEYGTIAHYKDDMIVENNYDLFFFNENYFKDEPSIVRINMESHIIWEKSSVT